MTGGRTRRGRDHRVASQPDLADHHRQQLAVRAHSNRTCLVCR